MTPATETPTAALALLGDLQPFATGEGRIHAVLGWDEDDRHLVHLPTSVPTDACAPLDELRRATETQPAQLTLDLGGPAAFQASSSGRTWRTWSLPSIPTGMRHLALDVVVRQLAAQIAGGQP